MKRKLIVVAGPTASGKTPVSIELAKRVNGEIISADSMQVYKYMDIGSAKVTADEMMGIKHYLVDVLEPGDGFHVQEFQKMAKEAMEEIYAKGKTPIIVGGTGFYIQAVVRDIDFSITDEALEVRQKVEAFYEKNGKEALYKWLEEIDPKGALNNHPNNIKRVERGIEYFLLTGERMSDHNEVQMAKETPYDLTFIVLTMERDLLYKRIDQRVDFMKERGLVEEVRKLKTMGYTKEMTAMQGLGYKETLDYLEGHLSLEEAIYIIKRDTRHFAKRQLTWFRREHDISWISVDQYGFNIDNICTEIIKIADS